MIRPLAAALLVIGALGLMGCRESQRVEMDMQVKQRAAASRAGLTLKRAQRIVAEVDGADVEDVTVMHRSASNGVATILASVPADPAMLTEDPIETIDLRWDMQENLPLHVMWSERLQFASRQPVTQDQAEEVVAELLDRWLPEEAPDTEPTPAERLRAPIYVVSWAGSLEGHLTGDQAVVQISAVTGLPISFSQRIARRRPSPGSIEVTRERALEIARGFLREEDARSADSVNLVAQLSLSAEQHPQAGPAWLVAIIAPDGRQQRVLTVDAMSGEVITRRVRQRFRDERYREEMPAPEGGVR